MELEQGREAGVSEAEEGGDGAGCEEEDGGETCFGDV